MVQIITIITNFHTAVVATPGQPFVKKPTRDTLRLFWLKAKTGEDCPVLRYMVEYKEAGLEDWSSVLTQGPVCECTLTLPHCTCYRVRVSAVYEDITSQPSEETPVSVDGEIHEKHKKRTKFLVFDLNIIMIHSSYYCSLDHRPLKEKELHPPRSTETPNREETSRADRLDR